LPFGESNATMILIAFRHGLRASDTGEFGKNHLGDHTDALPTSHGFQEFWG
jgi:arylsulfatase